MNRLINLILIVMTINIPIFSQKNDLGKELFNNLNKIRRDQKVKEFRLDSSLIKYKPTASIFEYKFLNNKDSLRSILRENGNFDYNVETFEMEIKNINELNKKNIENQYSTLNDVLNDSLYNRIGYHIEKDGDKYLILLVASQNFLEFEKYFMYVIKESADVSSECIVIPGKSKLNDIFYTVYHKKNAQIVPIVEKKRVTFNEGNRFELRINISPSEREIPKYIEVVNSQGKILSYIKQ